MPLLYDQSIFTCIQLNLFSIRPDYLQGSTELVNDLWKILFRHNRRHKVRLIFDYLAIQSSIDYNWWLKGGSMDVREFVYSLHHVLLIRKTIRDSGLEAVGYSLSKLGVYNCEFGE